MLTSTITRHVAQLGNAEIEARIEFIAHPPCGDGRHEPREPAHAEVTDVTLVRSTFRWDWSKGGGAGPEKTVISVRTVECPAWLLGDILADADTELHIEACELLADDADAADERREFRRAAE